MDQGPSSISRLPVQLLAKVLRHVGQADILTSCCLVSHTWHEAAVLAIDVVLLDHCLQDQANQLGAYLRRNAAASAITCIRVHGCPSRTPAVELQLPMQQLPSLQELVLERLAVSAAAPTDPSQPADAAAAGSPATADAAPAGPPAGDSAAQEEQEPPLLRPLLDPALAALTLLDLDKCNVRLQGLPSLTALAHLSLSAPNPREADKRLIERNKVVLVDALPRLSRLTSLYLGGTAYCAESALAQASHLTRLLDLHCDDLVCPAATLNSLPHSLTSLRLAFAAASPLGMGNQAEGLPASGPVISPSSTPRLCELTALQDLFVAQAEAFHVGVLTALTGLTSLSAGPLAAAPGEPRLGVLTALSKLQLLELFDVHEQHPALVSPADFAAISASQQLTRLELSCVKIDDLPSVFPPQRQLPNLVSLLGASVEWLWDRAALRSMVSACPNLQEFELGSNGGVDDVEALVWQRGLACLSALTKLTCLRLDAMDMAMPSGVWAQLAALTGLQLLTLQHLEEAQSVGLLQLTACQQLTRLSGSVFQAGGVPGIGLGDFAEFCLTNQAPEGSPPDVCSQLPQYVLAAVLGRFEVFASSPESMKDVVRAVLDLIRATMQAQQAMAAQLGTVQQQIKAMCRALGVPEVTGPDPAQQ